MKENIEKLMLMGFGIITISFLIISNARAQISEVVADRAVYYIMDMNHLEHSGKQMDDVYIPEKPE